MDRHYRLQRLAFLLTSALVAAPMLPTAAFSQGATSQDCPSGASGPVAGSSEPYEGGICDLEGFIPGNSSYNVAQAISADGTAVVGLASSPTADRAYIWTASGGIKDLGSLRADNSGNSYARAVSDDGGVVAGQAATDDGSSRRAFRWIDDGNGMLDLGSLRSSGLGDSNALAVSADGSVIIGAAETDTGYNHAFRWMDDGNGMRDLGTLRAGNAGMSTAKALSGDGGVITGSSATDHGQDQAFRWTEADGMESLGSLRADRLGYSEATAISTNGAVIIGRAETDDAQNRAFRWTETDGMVSLGTLRSNGLGTSTARALSADGSVIVGSARNDDGRERAFRWMDDGNGMIDLGTLTADNSGMSNAIAVSANGAVIVGGALADGGVSTAFRWTEADGMVSLGSLCITGSDCTSRATGISADGAVIIGYSENDADDDRAFIWLSRMQDLANLNASFATLAARSDAAIARQQDIAAGMLRQNASLDAGRSWLRISGDLAATGKAAEHGLARHTGATANLAYGYGIDGNVTIGTAIAFGGTGFSGFETGAHLGAGLWATYSETGADAAGWQADFGAAFSHGKAEITRGADLRNVMAASGDAALRGLAVHAGLGYGFAPVAGWRLTPKAGLSHFRSRRAAYDETGADFNASYEALSVSRTSVTLSLDAETRISERGTLSLGAGIDHDLAADRARLKGRSTIPGLESFALSSNLEHRDSRAFGTIGYGHDLGQGAKISAALRLGQSRYGDRVDSNASIGYELRF